MIARPFTGESGGYVRTPRRKDYATPPPAPTLLDRLKDAGREVIAIGKIGDIFAHRGTTQPAEALPPSEAAPAGRDELGAPPASPLVPLPADALPVAELPGSPLDEGVPVVV